MNVCFYTLFKKRLQHRCFVEDLRTAGSETSMQGSLFNKVAILTAWTHLAVLEAKAATRGVMWEKMFIEISSIHRKHLCQGLLFNKVASSRPATLLKKRLWHSYFSVNFAKFQEIPFYRTPLDDCFFRKRL